MRAAALSLILALAILAVAVPQTAQAAVTCRTYYVFREGDTKPYVAHTYDLSWSEIADANDMNSADKVKVGDRLCIPEGEAEEPVTPEDSDKAKIQVSVVGNTIRINVDDFSQRHTYQVKARAQRGLAVDEAGRIQVVRTMRRTFRSPTHNLRDVHLERMPEGHDHGRANRRTAVNPSSIAICRSEGAKPAGLLLRLTILSLFSSPKLHPFSGSFVYLGENIT
jgi:hypothetical protein